MAVQCSSSCLFILLPILLSTIGAQAQTDPANLLFGLRTNISRLELGGNYRVLKSSTKMNIVGLDVDIRSNRLFYSDVAAKTLHTAMLEGDSITQIETLLENITSQDGVAWDWVNQKLYWTTSGSSGENSTIEVMDINTKQRKLLDTYNDGTQARGIVVDPLNGWLFWSDYNETTAKIVRMSMDGTQSTIIVTTPSVQFPNGLTYDYKTQTLFWIDAGKDIIGSVKADGTQMRPHVDLSKHFSTSHGFNLEFFNGEFYFSDWRGDDVRKISSANTTEERGEVLRRFNRDPTTVRVLNIDRQPVPESENPCMNVQCGQGMCLLSDNSRGYSCVCPTGVNPSLCLANNCVPNGCLNGGACTPTGTCECKEGYSGVDCSEEILDTTQETSSPAPDTAGNKPSSIGEFSVSGTIFVGVVGTLLGVIILLTLIIAMIICMTLRSGYCRKNNHRTHSIGGLSDQSTQESPTHHVVVRGLTDHDYISIKSRDSPAPRGGIIINIESPSTAPMNQYSLHKTPLSISSKEVRINQSQKESIEVTNEPIQIDNDNQSNNNETESVDDEPPKSILERSLGSSIQPDSQFNSLNRRSESLQ